MSPTSDDCGEPQLGHKLAALGYSHVVVRRDSPAGRWMTGRPAPDGLTRGPEFEDGRVLVVGAERPRAYVGGLLGFYPREYFGETAWRWMGQSGTLTLVNATGESVAIALELELLAFPGDRRLEWLLDGRRLGGWRWRPSGGGTSSLWVRSPWAEHYPLRARPAVVANDVRGNYDPAPCLAVEAEGGESASVDGSLTAINWPHRDGSIARQRMARGRARL
jgi:hypothetical protein